MKFVPLEEVEQEQKSLKFVPLEAEPAAPKAEAPKKAEAAKPAPAPKKAEEDFATTGAMGEDLGSAIMSEAGEGLGVMNGKVPATPVKTPSKAPYKPEVRAAIEAQYDAASPKQRANMESAPGAMGDVARQRAQEYAKEPEVTKKVSPRVEARTERLIEAGEKPEFAQAAAQRGAEQGVVPGQEVAAIQREGTLDKTDFDFEMQKQYKDANVLVRGAMAGYQGYKQGALGVNQAVAELVGADEFARTQGLGAKEARVAVESMGENPNYVGRMFEGAISSIAQQLPAMTAGAISGSEAVVLGSMIAQSFGQEYAEGRAKGLDGLDAATRAGLMASFEGLGEKFGLKFAMDNIRRATSGMKTDALKDFLGNTLKKELPGEYLTTTGQFLTDLSSVGLNKNATLGDYLQQMADTTVQTLMQSGLMTGGTKAIEKGVGYLQTAGQQPQTQQTQPPAPPANPAEQTLSQSYAKQGMPPEQAAQEAKQEAAALTTPPAQDTTEQALRAALQSEAPNVPSTEPPPYVTEPSTSEQGTGLFSEPTGGAAGVSTNPIQRGLDAAERLVGSVNDREERQRASVEANKKRITDRLSKAFNSQQFPNLSPIFGVSWQQQTMASNPTPEQFQDAAYAKLEEMDYLGQRPTDTFTPATAPKVEEAKPVEAAASTEDEVQARKDAEYQDAINEGYDQLDAFEASKKKEPVEEKPSVAETTEAEQAKEERPEAPAAKPAAPAVAQDRTETLELLAGRNEDIEVEAEEKALLGINDHLKKWFGTTATGGLRKRRTGGGREKSEEAKTEEERQEQLEDINKLNRDAATLIKAADKYTPIPEAEQDGSQEQRERGRTGQYPTEAEYDYAEATRLHRLDLMRMALHGLALRSKSRPIKGYSAAADYIRDLKPAERARAKALWEGTIQPTALPVKPKATLTRAQLERFRAGEKLSKRGRPKKEKAAVAPTEAPTAKGVDWESEKPFEAATTTTEEDYTAYLNPPREDVSSKADLMRLFRSMRDDGSITEKDYEALTEQQDLTEEQEEELFLQKLDEREEVPPSKAQEEVEDRTIHDELDDDEKKVIAKHYGESSYNEVAQKKFVADVILALNEGLDAVSRVLHDIIKRLQASVLAGIMVMNTSFMTPPMQVAVPTTETRTVQVLAEVPKEVEGMSDAGKLAYQNILPAIQNDITKNNKLFVLTDKPSANVFIFKPDGSLLVQSKVLLGKTVGDYYKGGTDKVANRITPAGLFNLGLRDAARGGSEAQTAGHYDYGKVFVLDKAIDGEYSVTLFHSVWTHEKDAAQRLAALKKAGPEDSRYSFGCINLDKNVFGDLIAGHQAQMDGAKMFVVPDNPNATMSFVRGEAVDTGDIVRQRAPEVTKTITERVPTTAPSAEERKAPAILRKEQVAFGRRRRAEIEEGGATDLGMEPLAGKSRDREIAEQQLDMEPDPFFNELESLGGALAYIAGSPNKVESELALRLLAPDNRAALKDVQFVVVEKNDKIIPHDIKKMLNTKVDGYYVPDTKGGTVYVRGLSYGERTQGINNEIVLHEAFHAAGAKKIEYAMLAKRLGFPVDKNLSEAVQELEDLMGRAKAAFDAQGDKANTHLKFLDNADAFTNIQEFYAYGMTDSTLKSFLLNDVSGVIEKTSGFDALINAVLKLFGINPKLKSGLKDLVLISHEIMQAQQPSSTELAARLKEANTEIRLAAKRQAKSTAAAERDLKASQSPSAIIGNVGIVQSSARDFGPVGTFIENNFSSMHDGTLRGLLNVAPTSTLFKIGIANGITRLEETKQLIRDRGSMRMGIQKEMEAIVERWRKLNRKQLDLLADTMHLSTDLAEDPSLPVQYSGRIGVKSPELRNMWKQLAAVPDGHQLYKDVRDFYKKAAATFIANLKQQIATSNLPGNINDITTPKGKAFKEIVDTYETSIGSGPFFPLMRHGTYWARFGKKANVNFQLRESKNDIKKFINAQIEERKRLGDKRNMEELRAAGEADSGDDVKILHDKLKRESTDLRKIFKAIDSAATGASTAFDDLKKEIFQMHLLLLPEQSFRKMFIPRKNRAGYSRDALRNFVNVSSRLANQLAGSRYNRRISDSLAAAMSSLEGMKNKEHLELLVNEIKDRVELILNPQYETNGWDTAVRFANKFTFMYLLTDIRQAANNIWSLPSKGLPTLIKYFGEVATTKELARLMFGEGLVNQIGVRKVNANGVVSWHAPSMNLSAWVQNSPERVRAAELMERLEIGGHGTMTNDVYFASKAQALSLSERILDTTVRVSGALHQGSERAIREILFWSAYNLARKQKLPMPKAVQKAHDIVEEALYRYNPDEMPPWVNKAGPKFFFQFNKYPALTTNYYVVNMLEATGSLPSDVRGGAVKAILGSYMMAILGAGLAGGFGISTMIYLYGVIDGAWDKYADGRLKKSLKNMSPLRWFKTEFLPNQFGDIKIPGTDKTLANVLADGLFDTLTGSKISSGISEGSLWFDEPPTALDVDAWMSYIGQLVDLNKIAPFLGVANKFVSGFADWSRGDTRKAYEKWTPIKLLRNIMVSDRLKEEGLKDRDFDSIMKSSDFTEGQLFMQKLGFKPQAAADIEEVNYFLATNEKQISAQRDSLVNRWVQNAKRNDFESLAKANKAIRDFNRTYPYDKLIIDGEQLVEALDNKLEKSLGKVRGRQVLDKPEFDWLEKYRGEAKLKVIENAP